MVENLRYKKLIWTINIDGKVLGHIILTAYIWFTAQRMVLLNRFWITQGRCAFLMHIWRLWLFCKATCYIVMFWSRIFDAELVYCWGCLMYDDLEYRVAMNFVWSIQFDLTTLYQLDNEHRKIRESWHKTTSSFYATYLFMPSRHQRGNELFHVHNYGKSLSFFWFKIKTKKKNIYMWNNSIYYIFLLFSVLKFTQNLFHIIWECWYKCTVYRSR
jgi:hypothetical protein